MEKQVNSFVLSRKYTSLSEDVAKSDSIYAYINISGDIEVSITPSWSHKFKGLDTKPATSLSAKNMLVLNLNHTQSYGHIYSEIFSELYAIDKTYPDHDCVLTTISPIILNVINFFKIELSNKIKFIRKNKEDKYLLHFERLEIVNHCPKSYINKLKNVNNLKAAFHKLKPIINSEKNFLLFCSRSSSTADHGRNITSQNEEDIIKYLKHYSTKNNLQFYLLTGEEDNGTTTSVSKQYELFSNAKIVVGPHGGVMSNLIFLDPAKKPKVIEFSPVKGRTFSKLFHGAIDQFAEYYEIPYIIPEQILEKIDRKNDKTTIRQQAINLMKHIDCSIDLLELKKILPEA
jgi:hypothetical protein